MFPTAFVALTLAPGFGGGPFRDKPLHPVAVPASAVYGYTYAPAYDLDLVARYPARAYDPQPGDVIPMSDQQPLWTFFYALALTGAPGHIGIVARMPDGRLGIHEAGFNTSLTTRFTPLDYRLNHYPGKVWVRRRRCPLTPEQDARLTEFCTRTANTPYNIHGVSLQFTPFAHRGLLRTSHLGRPHGPEKPLFCSEAILESLVYAGCIDPETARPAATYPRDLFFDRSLNPYINRHPPLAAGWDAPALWTPVVGVAMKGKDRPTPADGVLLAPPELPPTQQRRLFRR